MSMKNKIKLINHFSGFFNIALNIFFKLHVKIKFNVKTDRFQLNKTTTNLNKMQMIVR